VEASYALSSPSQSLPRYPGDNLLGYTASNRQPFGLSVSDLPWCFAKKTARGGLSLSFNPIYDTFGPISSRLSVVDVMGL
jgi:hypothetical protein